MFTLTSLSPYSLLIKVVALVLLVIALYGALRAFESKYIHIGEHNIQVIFDKYKADEDKLLLASQLTNLSLRAEADRKQSDLKLIFDKKLSDLNIDNDKLKKDLKDALPHIASLLSDVRVYQARDSSGSSGVSKDALTTELSTESGRDCNRTLAIVTQAGQSCALDYDALANWSVSECKAMGGCK